MKTTYRFEPLEPRRLLSVLDPTFGPGGLQEIGSPPSGDATDPTSIITSSEILAFAPLTDGSFASVQDASAHDNASGDTSDSFSFERNDPAASVPDALYNVPAAQQDHLDHAKILPDADGKVILAEINGDTLTLARFVAGDTTDNNLSLDTTFAANGVATVTLAAFANTGIWTIAHDAAGRIVVAAAVGATPADSNTIAVVHFTANGALDTSFSSDGISQGPSFNGTVDLITVQSDDRLIVAGGDMQGSIDNITLLLRRLNPDGSLDVNFDDAGMVIINRGQEPVNNAIAFQSDGKILLSLSEIPFAPDSEYASELWRFNTNGTVDQTFGNAGIVSFGSDSGEAVLVAPTSGKITVLTPGQALRFNPDGSHDISFNGTGAAAALFSPLGDLNTPAAFQISDTAIIEQTDTVNIARIASRPAFAVTSDGIVITTSAPDNTIDLSETLSNNSFSATVNYNGTITHYDHFISDIDIESGDGHNTITFPVYVNAILVTGDGPDAITATPFNFDVGNFGATGADSISTGGGNDTITFQDSEIKELGIADVDTIDTGGGNDSILVTTNTFAQSILGGAGNDTISTGAAIDTIDAGDGDDRITCADVDPGLGHRSILGGDGNNSITAGDGTNDIAVGSGDDTIHAFGRDDNIYATGGGNDSITTGYGNDDITVSPYFDNGDDTSTINPIAHCTINSGDGSDVIQISEEPATVSAGDGNDLVLARSADIPQSIDGGAGNDSIQTDSGADTITGGDGNDTINSFGGADIIHGDDGNDVLTSGPGSQSLYGGAGNDILLAGDGSDLLSGGGGKDKLGGQGGNDRLYGGRGNDQLDGGRGNDRLYGQAGNDKLFAGSDDSSSNSSNTLDGGDGNDYAAPFSAADVLTSIELSPSTFP